MKYSFYLTILLLGAFTQKPSAQISWKHLNGPTGLLERPLSVSAEGNVFLSRQGLNQIDVSTDNGETWESHDLPFSLPYKFPEFIQLSSGNTYAAYGNTLYKYQYALHDWAKLTGFDAAERVFGDSEQRLWKLDSDGVLSYSTNEGETFTPVVSELFNFSVPIAAYNDAHNLYVELTLPENTLYHFTSGGQKQLVPLSINNLNIEFLRYNPYTGAAYMLTNDTPNPLKKSTDGGFNWMDVEFTTVFPDYPYVKQLSFQSSGAVWVVSERGILVSNDEGDHWTLFKVNGETEGYFPNALGISANAEKIFVYDAGCGKQDFYRSLDAGNTWTDLSPQFQNPNISSIVKDVNGVLYTQACRRNNVEVSADEGENWHTLTVHTPSQTFEPYSVSVAPNGSLFSAGVNDVFRSNDGGMTWQALDFQAFPVNIGQKIIATPDGNLYVLPWQNNAYQSTDNGASWHPSNLSAGFFLDSYPGDYFHPGGNYYKAEEYAIYRYKPDSDELEYLPLPAGNFLHSFTVTKTGRLIAIVSDINTFFNQEIYISDNEGESFQYAGTTPEWSQGILLFSGPSIVIMKLNDNYYRSLDDGLSWNLYFTAADFPALANCHYFSPDNYFYVGLFGEVIYRTESKLVATTDLSEVETSISIYPNPVTAQLNIAANPSIDGNFQLKVLDTNGRIVLQRMLYTLDKDYTGIDVKNLCTGLYYCEIREEEGRLLYAGKFIKN